MQEETKEKILKVQGKESSPKLYFTPNLSLIAPHSPLTKPGHRLYQARRPLGIHPLRYLPRPLA
ncbi:hypothetical protein BC936DRAFT_142849 [Jimgerdemannia flammicorona]|uniref:Uncharacterized protein n=1 Tax=Jimgerdemannia flammicorona TaxID=994334 RepID=A0A433DEN2_9FUNG|nr:hypothetical protein BC936DRAFT_142849 [Jimgerdemannia flammicorona]